MLQKGLEGMLGGRRAAFAILGETGIGKSLLAERLGRVAEDKGALFVVGKCDQWLPSFPWDPLCEAVRQIIRALVDEFVDPMPERAKVALRSVSSELEALVPEMTDKPPIPPGYDRAQLFAGLAELVKHAAECRPLVLLLEDVHWARPTFLEWLAYQLRRGQENSRVMLLMTCRTERPEGAEFQRWVESRGVRGRVKVIVLGRLEKESVLEYVRRASPPTPPPSPLMGEGPGKGVILPGKGVTVGDRLARYLWKETEGHPLLLAELWRLLQEQRGVAVRPDGIWDLTNWPLDPRAEKPAVPDRLRRAVLLRAEGLDEESKFLLQTASVFGMTLDPEAAAAIGQVHGEVGEHLAKLVDGGFVRRIDSEGIRAEFTHEKIRLAVYSGLSDLRRRYTHLKLAEGLEAKERAEPGLVAHHYLEVGHWEKALPYFAQAAEAARSHCSWTEAAWLLERAIELGRRVQPPGWEVREMDFRLTRGDLLWMCGRRRESAVELELGLATALAMGDARAEIDARRRLARVLLVQGDTDAAMDHALRALNLAEQSGTPRQLGGALWTMGYVTHWRGELGEALEHYFQSLSLAREEDSKEGEAACLNVIGINYAQKGWFDRAIESLDGSRERAG